MHKNDDYNRERIHALNKSIIVHPNQFQELGKKPRLQGPLQGQ